MERGPKTVCQRYVHDGAQALWRETYHDKDARPANVTRFLRSFPGGPTFFADSDGVLDVHLTDRLGRPWLAYRASEGAVPGPDRQTGIHRHGLSTKGQFCRNTGLLKSPPVAEWPWLGRQPWYLHAVEPDYLLGRRGQRGWDGKYYDAGVCISIPKEKKPTWWDEVMMGFGIALAVLAATVAVFATAGAILAAGLLAAGVASATVTSVMIGLGIGVGVSLGGVALATAVGGRLGQGQSLGEAIGGGLADLTGISGVYAGITGKDIAAQEDLGLSYEQRGQMFGQGLVQVAATAFGAYKGIRAGIRKFRAWRQARSLQAGPDVEFSGGTKGSGYADISGVTGKTARARNRHIDATIKQHLRGINLTHKARYNPFMESPPGKIRYGAAKRGVGTQVSRHAFRSQCKLTETLVHEELHHRFWRNNLLNHHDDSALNEKFMRIVARYLEMRGW